MLLAKAHAFSVGCATREEVADAFDRMNEAFFKPADQAYADEITPEGTLLDYRGQNANMHMCEACLAAHEFTGEARYLDRAEMLIERFAFDLASQSGNLVWEHYRADWTVDWDYNKDNPGNIFKPWGFQTGHQTEWAKLLMIAHQFRPNPRWVARAAHLQRAAYRHGWDAQHGGLIYGFAPDHSPCDTDKYFWVQAESFASAWRLWRHTGEAEFLQQYQAIWQWSWAHMVDHEHGAWFRILGADGPKTRKHQVPRRQGGLPHHGCLLGRVVGRRLRGLSAQRPSLGGSLLGDARFLNHLAPALDVAVQQLRQLGRAAGFGFHVETGQSLHHLGVGQYFGHFSAQAIDHVFGRFARRRQRRSKTTR